MELVLLLDLTSALVIVTAERVDSERLVSPWTAACLVLGLVGLYLALLVYTRSLEVVEYRVLGHRTVVGGPWKGEGWWGRLAWWATSAMALELREYPELVMVEADIEVEGDDDITFFDVQRRGMRKVIDYSRGENLGVADRDGRIRKFRPGLTSPIRTGLRKGKQEGALVASPSIVISTSRREFGMIPQPRATLSRTRISFVPKQRFAVIQFSGGIPTFHLIKKYEDCVRRSLADAGLRPVGDDIILLQYDLPVMIPFLRRNELLLEYATE